MDCRPKYNNIGQRLVSISSPDHWDIYIGVCLPLSLSLLPGYVTIKI